MQGTDNKDLRSLRAAVTAGAICPEELCGKMKTTYGCDVVVKVASIHSKKEKKKFR